MGAPFVWFDLTAADVAGTSNSYRERFGWTIGPGMGDYEGWITDGDQPWAGILTGESRMRTGLAGAARRATCRWQPFQDRQRPAVRPEQAVVQDDAGLCVLARVTRPADRPRAAAAHHPDRDSPRLRRLRTPRRGPQPVPVSATDPAVVSEIDGYITAALKRGGELSDPTGPGRQPGSRRTGRRHSSRYGTAFR